MKPTSRAHLVRKLRSWYAQYPLAKQVFDWASKRPRDELETTIHRLEKEAVISHAEAILAAKELEKIGCGKFIVGRREKKSRIKWLFRPESIGRVAKGDGNDLEVLNPVGEWQEDLGNTDPHRDDFDSSGHMLYVRDDRIVISLPRKLTKQEADWLASSIRSLVSKR